MDPPHPPRRQHIGTLHHTGSSSSGTSSQDVKPEGRAEQAEYSQASRGSSNVQAARGVVVGRPITRTRASYSCQSCRRRKVKCDKVHPICGECSRNKDQCVYSSGPGLGIPVNTAQTHATSSTSESGGSTPAALYPSRVVDAEDGSSGVKRQRTHSGSLASVGAEISGMVASTVGAGTGSVEVKEIGSRLDRLTAMVEQLVRAQPHSASVESTSAQLTPYPTSQKSSPREQRKRGGDAMMHPDPRALEQIQLAPIERTFSAPPRMEEEDETSLEEPPGRRASGSSDLNIGHLALEGSGRSSYIGNTYWASIYDEVAELNQLLRDQTRYHNPPERFRSNAAPPLNPSGGQTTTASGSISGNPFRSQGEDIRSSSGPLQADTQKVNLLQPSDQSTSSRFYRILPEVLANLPSKCQCDVLYRAFMQGMHPIMPVIYPPDCLQEYNEFWEWHDNYDHGSVAFAKPSFFPLLYAILYGGSVTCHVEVLRTEFNESRTSLSHRLHDEVTRSLAMVSFPRTPSMYSLVAFLIVQSILMREEEPMVCSTFITLALRVAQSMGLHRDGSRFGLDSHEAEVRRRVWWHIVYLDTIIATTLGLPPLVNLDYCDTTEVTDLKDQYVGTDAGKEYERATSLEQRPPALTDDVARGAHDSMVSAGGLYNKVKFYNTTILKRIDRILLGVKPILIKDVQKIQDIYNQCRDQMTTMVGRIPWNGQPEIEPYTDIDSQVQTYMGIYPPRIAGNAHEWEKLVEAQPLDNISELEIRCQQEGYFAFPAWVRIVSSLLIDKTFCVSYQPFLRTSKSQMWSVYRQRALRHCHTFMDKFILLSTVKCFHTFQWSWPGNHQPMQAAMILLVDLYRDPMSLEAPKSRSYIDKLFALSGPDGGIVRSDDGVQNQRPLREGGREAWDMLRRLRQKAWEKAGLDPDVLWTDAEQGRVGFSHPLTSGERMMKDIRQSQFPVQRPPEKQEFPHQSPELQQAGAATVTTGSMSQNQIESTSVPVATAPPRSSSMITPITMDPTLPSIPYTTHGSSREPEEFNWDEWDSVFGEYLRVGDLMDVDAQNQWPFQDDHNT